MIGFEPIRLSSLPPQDSVFTYFTTSAIEKIYVFISSIGISSKLLNSSFLLSTPNHSYIMSNNPPQFAQLSNINKVRNVKKKATMRPGFYADMLKSTPEQLLSINTTRWRTLQNY